MGLPPVELLLTCRFLLLGEVLEFPVPSPLEASLGPAVLPAQPCRRVVSTLEMPPECVDHPYFESHELVAPTEETVPDRSAFGTHWGLVFFFGDDPIKMRDLLKAQEDLDFYV